MIQSVPGVRKVRKWGRKSVQGREKRCRRTEKSEEGARAQVEMGS